MISPKAQYNLKNARQYFREHLQVGDYYAQENAVQGEWFGLGADKLGLQGTVGEQAFLELCEGLNPVTGERLTMRKNTTRFANGKETANRRIFYDFTISPPKSVSILGLYQDERIVEIHDAAIRKAVSEMESYAMTRVRKKGRSDDRETGNVVGACFRHDTSRALDPHLHTHCIVMNATFDAVEKRWKALQNYEMLKAQKFVENFYYHELAKGLKKLGYAIENNVRDFEVQGVSHKLVEKFSKRRQQIDEAVEEHVSNGKFVWNVKELRAQIAHEKRARKIRDSSAEKLVEHWDSQLTNEERQLLKTVLARSRPSPNTKLGIEAIVDWADEHMFERKSVVEDYQLKAAALARGRGESFALEKLDAEIVKRGYLGNGKGHKITSNLTLGRELEIVLAAKNGRMKHNHYCEEYLPSIPTVTEDQKRAIEKILSSRDFVTLFRGGAGTGKTFALQEVDRALKLEGFEVVVLAPQRQQVMDLQNDGFEAKTVSSFLNGCKLPEGSVVIVDEAGQIGGKQMSDLFRAVKKADSRIILSGDTRQHGAVEASDALRAIEIHAGLFPAELNSIRRQNPDDARNEKERAFISEYRGAVKAASSGKILDSFERLDALGCVEELDEDSHSERLAEDYVSASRSGENTLVVAQTWDEIHAVNDAVRTRLKRGGMLGEDTELDFYETRELDSAQKRDARFYQENDYAFFVRSYGRFGKGDVAKVDATGPTGVSLTMEGKTSKVGFKRSSSYVVARKRKIPLAVGDRLQMKFNGMSMEGRPILNGELVTVSRIFKNGNVSVRDGSGEAKTLSPDQRLANLGYAVTSYASQGKTVDTVLFSDSQSKAATNRNQWYVSISRARRKIRIYTSSKEELRENLQRDGKRPLAIDFAGKKIPRESVARKKVKHMNAMRERALIAAKQFMLASRWGVGKTMSYFRRNRIMRMR